MNCFSWAPSFLHGFSIRFSLSYLLTFNNNFSFLDSFQKTQKLRILESGIGVIHHDLKHWRRTIEYVCLFFLIWDFSLLETCLHLHFILPPLSLFFDSHLFELLLHLPLLKSKIFLWFLPMHLLHHHHLLLLGNCFIVLCVHNLVQLCSILKMLLF